MSLPLPANLNTQGQISWDNLGHQTLSFSVDVLRRIANAGVNPYTITVGQALCRSLRMGTQGRRNVMEAVSQLRSYSGWGKLLHFGFGVQSLPRLLGTTDEGLCLLALTAAMTENYDADFAGNVIFDIVSLLGAPEDFTPSIGEWVRISDACAGVLANTKFSLLVDHFFNMCSPRVCKMERRSIGQQHWAPPWQRAPQSWTFARALMAYGEISAMKTQSVTIKGGFNIGWLAALAVFLFDFNITIQAESDESVIFSNCPGFSDCQVRFILLEEGNHEPDFSVLSRTVSLKSITEIMILEDTHSYPPTGRVPWQRCLVTTFGIEFALMVNHSELIGELIGYAAKILELQSTQAKLIYEIEFDFPTPCSREAPYLGNSSSKGAPFVSNTFKWFPEVDIEDVRSTAIAALNIQHPILAYNETMNRMKDLCQCTDCPGGVIARSKTDRCFVNIFETVIGISQLLSRAAHITEGILPTVSGIRSLQRDLRTDLTPAGRLMQIVSQVWYSSSKSTEICSNDISDTLILFGGWSSSSSYQASSTPSTYNLAETRKGVCVYVDQLRDMLLASDDLSRYNVVSGKIEKSGHLYQSVFDESITRTNKEIQPQYEMLLGYQYAQSLITHPKTGSLTIRQTSSSLYTKFTTIDRTQWSDGAASADFLLGRVVEAAIRGVQTVKGDQFHLTCACSIFQLGINWNTLGNGDLQTVYDGRHITIVTSHLRDRTLDFGLLLGLNDVMCLVRGQSCLGRALEVAKRLPKPDMPVFILDF